MQHFADEPEPARSHDLDRLLAKIPDAIEREGLPPGFRMRADSHYVEALDSPIPAQRAKEPLPQPPGSPAASCMTAIEGVLRGIASAAALAAAPSAVMRGGAARL